MKSIKLEPCIGSIANIKLAISGITKYPVVRRRMTVGLLSLTSTIESTVLPLHVSGV